MMSNPLILEVGGLRRVSLRWRAWLALAGLLYPALAVDGQAVTADVERQLLAARDTVWRAWFGYDTVRLNRSLPPAATAAGPGSSGTEWEDRTAILAGARQFAAAGARLEHLEFDNTSIALRGNVAIVTSNYAYITRTKTLAD